MTLKYHCKECGKVINPHEEDPLMHVIEWHIDVEEYLEQIDESESK